MNLCRYLFVLLLLVSCQKASPAPASFSGTVMTVPYRIMVGQSLDAAQTAAVQKIVQETFAEINHVFNHWNPDSEVSRFNRQSAGQAFTLSPALHEFLSRCGELVVLTEGHFDPTVEPLWALWRESLLNGTAPDAVQTAEVALRVGWKHLKFSENTVIKDVDGVSLNFDGAAKGHAVDLLTERLKIKGFEHLLVEWGGEMRSSGQHPQGRPWRVAIRSIDGQQEPIANLDLISSALATSGDYLQNWTIGSGSSYTHIIDPTTFQAVQLLPGNIASVSVLAPDCMLADALATAAIAWNNAEASEKWMKRLQHKLPGVQFWFFPR